MGLRSAVVWEDKLKMDGLPQRWVGLVVGDVPSVGVVAKKDDFR
jgi:hypothetical protein